MKDVAVTLLQDVKGVGAKGDVIRCSPGYARNALFSRGLARPADEQDERAMTAREADKRQQDKRRIEEERHLLASLDGSAVTVTARANEDRKLYGSVNTSAVLASLVAAGKRGLTADMVTIPEPITMLGNHIVRIAIGGKSASLTVRVVAQE